MKYIYSMKYIYLYAHMYAKNMNNYRLINREMGQMR